MDYPKICLILVIVLLVLLIIYITFRKHNESFLDTMYYQPNCSFPWFRDRYGFCRGLTTGEMPSIEWESAGGDSCAGYFLGGVVS